MKAGPLKSWLIRQPLSEALRAAMKLTYRVEDQGVRLLIADDPWFVRELVQQGTDRMLKLWEQIWMVMHPERSVPQRIPDDWLPVFRSGADPAFGDRRCLAIVGVIPDLPMTLLTTNVAVEHKGPISVRQLIEGQFFWSDDPERDRKGILVKLESDDARADGYWTSDKVHSGAMWVTPSLRGKRADGPPIAASMAPLMRLVAHIGLKPDLIVGTVADPRLTKTFGSRVDGQIHVTEAGETKTQALHIYDDADMAKCIGDVLADAEPTNQQTAKAGDVG